MTTTLKVQVPPDFAAIVPVLLGHYPSPGDAVIIALRHGQTPFGARFDQHTGTTGAELAATVNRAVERNGGADDLVLITYEASPETHAEIASHFTLLESLAVSGAVLYDRTGVEWNVPAAAVNPNNDNIRGSRASMSIRPQPVSRTALFLFHGATLVDENERCRSLADALQGPDSMAIAANLIGNDEQAVAMRHLLDHEITDEVVSFWQTCAGNYVLERPRLANMFALAGYLAGRGVAVISTYEVVRDHNITKEGPWIDLLTRLAEEGVHPDVVRSMLEQALDEHDRR